MGSRIPVCWCGASDFQAFGSNYRLCKSCHTLVALDGLSNDQTAVLDGETEDGGLRRSPSDQQEALLQDADRRARADLPERCVDWLATLLRYRSPPARILEVGAGHGACSELLRLAGYDATAVDLGTSVPGFATARFGMPHPVGQVVEHALEEASFDVIVGNDVLEHLGDPEQTMQRCVELLTPDGLLFIQTPEYPDGRSFEELAAEDEFFMTHTDRPHTERLYLFDKHALEVLLGRIGLREVAYEEPLEPHGILCVASRTPLQRTKETDPGNLIGNAPNAPFARALLDARANVVQLETDRADRLVLIELLEGALAESEADRSERLAVIEVLEHALAASEADRAERLETIERLGSALKVCEADSAARLEVIEQLDTALQAEHEGPTSAT